MLLDLNSHYFHKRVHNGPADVAAAEIDRSP